MRTVDRSKIFSAALVLVAVLALSITAATISSTVGGPEGQEKIHIDPGENQGEEQIGDQNQGNVSDQNGQIQSGGSSIDLTICVELLRGPLAIVATIGAAILLFAGIYRRYNAATTLLVGSGVVPAVFATYFFLTNCATALGGNTNTRSFDNPVSGGGLVEAPSVPTWMLGVGLVGVVAVAAVTLYSVTGEDETYYPAEEDEDLDEPDAADFAAAAGRAADRIEEGNVPVDNAVYRAWYEMTMLLDIPNPETSSPMDFADAAIELSFDEGDVTELTELFNEVRYGHRDPESREDRALKIMRHIEDEYGKSGGEQ